MNRLARRVHHAILVTFERRDGAILQQVYRSLNSAEKKRQRCADAGLRCQLTLVRILPVGVAPLPAVATLEQIAELIGGDDR